MCCRSLDIRVGSHIYQERMPGGIGAEQIASIGLYQAVPAGDVRLSAFALDLFGFGVYTFPQGAAGAMSFHDPLEGTEITIQEESGRQSLRTLSPPFFGL